MCCWCVHVRVQVHRSEGIIYMVLECGDIDLARLLQARSTGLGMACAIAVQTSKRCWATAELSMNG